MSKINNLSHMKVKWSELLFKCSLKTLPKLAFDKLKDNTSQFIELVNELPMDYEVQRLCIRTASFPLELRRIAARRLYLSNREVEGLPDYIKFARHWEAFSKGVDTNLRDLVRTSISNMLNDNLSVISDGRVVDINPKHRSANTVVVYLQPRYFYVGENPFIPHWNSTQLFKSLLSAASSNNIALLPLVLPFTNILPKDDFPGFSRVGHHTFGVDAKCLHLKIAYLKEYAYVDRTGFGPFSDIGHNFDLDRDLSRKNIDEIEEFHLRLFSKYCVARESKFKQPDEILRTPRSEGNVFFAMQTTDDSVIQAQYIDQYSAIEIILEAFMGSDRKLLVKKHPFDNSSETATFLLKINSHPNCVLSNGNVHDLIERCDVTVCINSGVGLEALLHLKPVINIGLSDYRFVTKTAKTKTELLWLLDNFNIEFKPNTIKSFLYYFFNKHVCHVNDEKAISERLLAIL